MGVNVSGKDGKGEKLQGAAEHLAVGPPPVYLGIRTADAEATTIQHIDREAIHKHSG